MNGKMNVEAYELYLRKSVQGYKNLNIPPKRYPPLFIEVEAGAPVQLYADNLRSVYEKLGIQEFLGDNTSICIRFERIPDNADEHFMKQLNSKMYYIANNRFKNEYIGMIFIDISAWSGHAHDKALRALLSFIRAKKDTITFVLLAKEDDDKNDDLYMVVNSYFETRRLSIQQTKESIIESVRAIVRQFDCFLATSAEPIVEECRKTLVEVCGLSEERAKETICSCVEDIVLEYKLSHVGNLMITAEVLDKINTTGTWLASMARTHPRNSIGFMADQTGGARNEW